MISRNEELERNQGKWVAMNRAFKNKKKYNRKDNKKELRKNLNSYFFTTDCHVYEVYHHNLLGNLSNH